MYNLLGNQDAGLAVGRRTYSLLLEKVNVLAKEAGNVAICNKPQTLFHMKSAHWPHVSEFERL